MLSLPVPDPVQLRVSSASARYQNGDDTTKALNWCPSTTPYQVNIGRESPLVQGPVLEFDTSMWAEGSRVQRERQPLLQYSVRLGTQRPTLKQKERQEPLGCRLSWCPSMTAYNAEERAEFSARVR